MSSESFMLLVVKEENRNTDASMSLRSVETRLTLVLICPPKPRSVGPPGKDRSKDPLSFNVFSTEEVMLRHLLQMANEEKLFQVQL